MISLDLVYIMAPVFYFISIFSGDKYRSGAVIISASITINIITFSILDLGANVSFTSSIGVAIYFDALTALILTYFMRKDKLAIKQAMLLSFATICHIMIIYDLSIQSSSFSNLFYLWYDELIITIGLLQMMVAYAAMVDGITNASRTLQALLYRLNVNYNRICKNTLTYKKRKVNP